MAKGQMRSNKEKKKPKQDKNKAKGPAAPCVPLRRRARSGQAGVRPGEEVAGRVAELPGPIGLHANGGGVSACKMVERNASVTHRARRCRHSDGCSNVPAHRPRRAMRASRSAAA